MRRMMKKRNWFVGGIFVLLAVIALIVGISIGHTQKIYAKSDEQKYYSNIVVSEGDSLWTIAENYMDQQHYESIYQYIDELKRVNCLTSDSIYVGQNLIVTYYNNAQ